MFTYFYIAFVLMWLGYWTFYFTHLRQEPVTLGLLAWALFVTFCPGFNMVVAGIAFVAIMEEHQIWKKRLW